VLIGERAERSGRIYNGDKNGLAMKILELKDRQALPKEFLPKGGIGCEMGVREGLHAETLLLSEPKELHLIDFWSIQGARDSKWSKYGETAKAKFVDNPIVTIHDGKVEDVMPTFPENYFDWIYIDTWHGYYAVKRDISLALPRVKHHGILCGHDFAVTPKTDSHWREKCGWGTSVVRAVLELIQNGEGHQMVAISNIRMAEWVVRVNKPELQDAA